MEEYSDDKGLIGPQPSSMTHPDEQQLELDHFLHEHPLKPADMEDEDSVICALCDNQVLGQSYCCRPCDFYMHEACTNIPGEICHFIHSCPLFLAFSYYVKCNACDVTSTGLFYECLTCDCRVDYACMLNQLPSTSTNPEAQERIEAPLHRHPLSIVENIREDDRVLCEVCQKFCYGPIYYECSVCEFYVHKSCVEIPRQLYSFYHRCRFPLVLLICPDYNCRHCWRAGFGVSYACIRCGFKLHLKCALSFEGKLTDHKLEHICHETDDLLKKMECLGCKFPLEKPWSEHLLEVQTLLHPEHTLILYIEEDFGACHVCLGGCCRQLCIRCDKCNFSCGPKCIYLMPTVQFTDHDSHLLTFVDKVHGHAKCNACKRTCSGMPAIRCLECPFNLHLLCGPLPHTIKYDHIHPLTLKDYIIEDYDEQYCYSCEKERDPLLPVYNCKRCSYTAEISCVMPEVIACLRGEREEHISLRCVNKPLTKKNKVIIRKSTMEKSEFNKAEQDNVKDLSEEVLENQSLFLADIYNCLNEDEQNKFRDTIQRMVDEVTWPTDNDDLNDYSEKESFEDDMGYDSEEKSSEGNTGQSSEESFENKSRGHACNIPEVSLYSEKAFTELTETLDSDIDSSSRIQLSLSEYDKQLVKYDKYIIPRIFIPILKELMNGKYGDISSSSMLDPRLKSICFMYLSELIYSMRTTKVIEVKKNKLQAWWNRTKMLQLMGFRVEFIQDHLMRVASSYFGRRATNFANKTSEKQVSKIERLKKEIGVLMVRVEELEVEHRDHLEDVESATTSFMTKCFSDFEAMKWRAAAEGLL